MPTSPNVGNYGFPFKHIPDISAEAAREIRRNFEAVFNRPNADLFDAVIDPILTTSDVANHIYPNLTTLLAAESWLPGRLFNVGVRQRFDIAIIEPNSPLDMSTKGNLALFGLANIIPTASLKPWNWAQLGTTATQQVFYYNLTIGPSSSGT